MTEPTPPPIDSPVVRELVARVHAGDTDGFLAMFTPGGSVDDWGRVFTGPDEIRRWSDVEFIGARGRMTDIVESRDGNDVVVTTDWVSEHHTGPSRFQFTLSGDRVSRMTIREG